MGSGWIVTRPTGGGPRHEVRFRPGGRGPQHYGGRFKTRDEAEARLVAIELKMAASLDAEAEDLLVPDGWTPPVEIAGYVYAIGAAARVKIGWSENPLVRFQRLNTESSIPLRLLCVSASLTRDLEYDLHRAFREHRTRGEWFRLPHGWQVTWAACVLDHFARSVAGARVPARVQQVGEVEKDAG